MTRKTVFATLFLLSLGALIALFVMPNPFLYNSLASSKIAGIAYSGHARPRDFHETTELVRGKIMKIAIAMQFRASSIGQFDNVFQTAPMNSGVRLELSKPNTLAVIVGADNVSGYLPYIVTKTFSLNRWHSFVMDVSQSNHVHIFFDDKPIVDQTDPSLLYDVTDIAFGTAFNKTRTFNGEIKDASISYGIYEVNPNGASTLNGMKIGCFVLGLIFLFFLSGVDGAKNLEEDPDERGRHA